MKKSDLKAFFDKKATLIAISILIAIAFWAVVVYSISSDFSRPMYDIPITLTSSSYRSYGLELVEGGDATVTVTVNGSRGTVGSLTAEDLAGGPPHI